MKDRKIERHKDGNTEQKKDKKTQWDIKTESKGRKEQKNWIKFVICQTPNYHCTPNVVICLLVSIGY